MDVGEDWGDTINKMAEYKCEICGQTGARFRKYRTVKGLILFSTTGYSKARSLCEKHKVFGGMNVILMNLVLGWWGIHAFFWNILAMVENLRGGLDVTAKMEALLAASVEESKKLIEKAKV